MKKVNVTFSSVPDYSNNAKSLYLYMVSKYDYNYLWVVYDKKNYNTMKENGINVVLFGTNEFEKKVSKSDIIFTTHANLVDYKPQNSFYVELWHGVSPKCAGYFSDVVSDYDKEWIRNVKSKVDYFVVPSEFWRTIFSTRYGIDYSRVLPLGFPKINDYLCKLTKKKYKKIFDFDISNFRKIIFYLPTFRKGCNREQESTINDVNILNIESYDEKLLIKYLHDNNYLLCIKYHPKEETDFKKIDDDNIFYLSESMLSNANVTISELLSISDMLITDYSSVGLEYLVTGKPVLYLVNDIDDYSSNRGIMFNDIDFWFFGNKIKNITDFFISVTDSFKNNSSNIEMINRRKLFFGDEFQKASSRIFEYFFVKNGLNCKLESYVDELDLANQSNKKLKEQLLVISANEEKLKESLEIIEKDNNTLRDEIKRCNDELSSIYLSKSWKLISFLRRVFKK